MTEDQLCNILKMKYQSGLSLRQIAAGYGRPITHADIQRGIRGIFPIAPTKRKVLGLPEYRPAPVCPVHGIVHLGRCPIIMPQVYRDLFSMPTKLLAQMISSRIDYSG